MLPLLIGPLLALPALVPAPEPLNGPQSGPLEMPLKGGGIKDDLGPPGLVPLSGGRTQVGATKKDIEALVEEIPTVKGNLRSLDAETPQHPVSVNPFYLGLTEVTNEQYAVFVRTTGHRPPQSWGATTIDEVQNRLLVENGKRNQELRSRGEPTVKFVFDRAEWWSRNWKESEWEIPEGAALRPVTFVDYSDVRAYCKWAGVRLPTEFEYQHAVRGSSKNLFPWGNEWEDGKYAATNEIKRRKTTFDVGSFPEGASDSGILDLAGNVWEWTSSPYLAYPKFKKNTYKFGRKKEEFHEPKWDGNQRVVVGGCFENSRAVARCTTRRPTERTQMTRGLGFRVAASIPPGVDIARAIFETEVRNSDSRPSGVAYLLDQAVAQDRWEPAVGSPQAPTGYGVIGGYHYLIFVPVEPLEESQDLAFQRKTLVAPQHLGFLALNAPMLEPALSPGTYLVAFRAKGEARAPEVEETDEQEEEGQEKSKRPEKVIDPLADVIDTGKDNLLLFDAHTGELAAHIPILGVTFQKELPGGELTPLIKTIEVENPDDPKNPLEIEERWLKLDVQIATRIRRRCLPFSLQLKPEEGYLEQDWRRSKRTGK